jgi:hypothetical protein
MDAILVGGRPPGLGGDDAGLDALADEIALEFGERRHHRRDHLAVRRRQVELEA